jgi:hypothetical protein
MGERLIRMLLADPAGAIAGHPDLTMLNAFRSWEDRHVLSGLDGEQIRAAISPRFPVRTVACFSFAVGRRHRYRVFEGFPYARPDFASKAHRQRFNILANRAVRIDVGMRC